MGMFSYYAFHSFINQIRKLLKTWVLIFIVVCALIGGLIGFGAAMLTDAVDEKAAAEQETVEVMEEADAFDFAERFGIEPAAAAELALTAIVTGVLTFLVLNADKNGARMFLPADVALLFASPMKPQSVLIFRVATTLGTAAFLAVYMLIQLPNIMNLFDMNIWAAVALLMDFGMVFAVGSILQVFVYLKRAQSRFWHQNSSRMVYGLLAAVGVCYAAFWKTSGLTPLQGAAAFFNAPISRWVPFVGWMKAVPLWANEGKLGMALLAALLNIAGIAGIVRLIGRTEVDFYEDAMAKSEETAAKMAQIQETQEGRTAMKKRKKDRSEKIMRDGMRHGRGANVYFFKTMYNRRRFAHLGLFTKTTETYFTAAVGIAALCRFVIDTQSPIPMVAAISVIAFFRAMGNPLAEDVMMGYFSLIPESTRKKLFWSLLGSTACCLLDFLPGLIVGMILMGAKATEVLAWIPLILTLDLYSTIVGTFINISTPANAGSTLKQYVMILFIYFGLLPDIGILAVGMVLEYLVPAIVAACLVNLLLTLLFFLLAASFLEPGDGKRNIRAEECVGDPQQAKKDFSRVGWGISALVVGAVGSQILAVFLMGMTDSAFAQSETAFWLATFLPIYCIGVPMGLAVLRKVPAVPIAARKLNIRQMVTAFFISVFLMYSGNILGSLLTSLIHKLIDIPARNALMDYATSDSLLLKILFVVILAPCIEEFLFRKTLIDRMHPYGGRLAVISSALLFGLFHFNLTQFVYAFALGLVFGYLYLKSGKLRYSVILHMIVNCMGMVIAPALMANAEVENLDQMTLDAGFLQNYGGIAAFYGYLAVLLVCVLTGLVLLITNRRQITFLPETKQLPRKGVVKATWGSLGMVLAMILCLAMFAVNLVSLS